MWALLAPLVIMAGYRIIVGGGTRVPIVGAGPLGQLREEDAPEVARYVLGVRQRESLEATRARIESAISEYPDLLVIGLDPETLLLDEASARATLAELATRTERAFGVPVVVGFSAPSGASEPLRAAVGRTRAWFRGELCARGRYRICVEVPDGATRGQVVEVIASGVRDGLARLDALHASTQVGR
ncbi:MAG: hypothetical protein H6721_24545 [Sandaracinus sp.]|nr:hypothetical protein [Sandaracinus sp.]